MRLNIISQIHYNNRNHSHLLISDSFLPKSWYAITNVCLFSKVSSRNEIWHIVCNISLDYPVSELKWMHSWTYLYYAYIWFMRKFIRYTYTDITNINSNTQNPHILLYMMNVKYCMRWVCNKTVPPAYMCCIYTVYMMHGTLPDTHIICSYIKNVNSPNGHILLNLTNINAWNKMAVAPDKRGCVMRDKPRIHSFLLTFNHHSQADKSIYFMFL